MKPICSKLENWLTLEMWWKHPTRSILISESETRLKVKTVIIRTSFDIHFHIVNLGEVHSFLNPISTFINGTINQYHYFINLPAPASCTQLLNKTFTLPYRWRLKNRSYIFQEGSENFISHPVNIWLLRSPESNVIMIVFHHLDIAIICHLDTHHSIVVL